MLHKSLFLAVLTCFFIMLTACQRPQSTVAVVNPAEVFETCDVCVQGGEYLKNKAESLSQELATMQQTIQGSKNQAEDVKKFEARYQLLQQEINAEQNRIGQLLTEEFKKVLDEYRTKNNLQAILLKDAAISFDNSLDVTQAVVQLMNEKKIDLQLKVTPEPTPAPAVSAEENKEENIGSPVGNPVNDGPVDTPEENNKEKAASGEDSTGQEEDTTPTPEPAQ